MGATLQMLERLANFAHGEDAVHDGAHLVQGDGSIHGFEHFPATHEDPLDADILHEDGHGVDLVGSTSQDPYQADMAAGANGAQRFTQSASPADFDDVIDPLAGQRAGFFFPIRGGFVVDAIRCPQATEHDPAWRRCWRWR